MVTKLNHFVTIYLCRRKLIYVVDSMESMIGLNRHRSETPSKWREHAEWRLVNKEWLRYSQRIAIMMLDRMEEFNLTQKAVAEKMGCSQQYISRVLKGTENLSIETISKIESALDPSILKSVCAPH